MSAIAHIATYLSALAATLAGGRAGELSYRPALANLLGALLPAVNFTHEGKQLPAVGAPDFLAYATLHGASRLIGCIETKNLQDQDLHGQRDNQQQFNRYKNNIPNCVFTNYLRFAFYQDAKLIDDIAIAELAPNGEIRHLSQNHARFIALLESAFIGQEFRIATADQLVAAMANRTRLLADAIAAALQQPHSDAGRLFTNYLHVFRQRLLKTIAPEEFADMAAQTIAYGFLIARAKMPPDDQFTRQRAGDLIPSAIHFLRGFFNHVAGGNIAPSIKWMVDSMADIFAAADIQKIMHRHGQQTGAQDPVFHFYESFLSKYAPQERARRGVWYTPEPVVNFITRAVDDILQQQFALPLGLAANDYEAAPVNVVPERKAADGAAPEPQPRLFHKVQILDPAAGTGSFLAEVIRRIRAKIDDGAWSDYVEDHLLPRVNGFEILMAPYAMAHLQLNELLKALGYAPRQDPQPRCQIYLSDALQRQDAEGGLLLDEWLMRETEEANIIKRYAPVMCVLGNPPYLAASANKGDWIMDLMQSYKLEPGAAARLQEKNPKWLNDDYVKFLRCAQHFIEKGGRGVAAFINPHGYLDNRTFRGMRWQLLRAYDRIYVIDLHGNVNKQEAAPDGGKDDNVFNIQQGVSINIFVKTGDKPDGDLAQVFHHDLYGERDHKYQFLMDNSLDTVPFQTLAPQAPMFYMVPRDYTLESDYNAGFLLTDLFPLHGVGIISKRDQLAFQHSQSDMRQLAAQIHDLSPAQIRARFPQGNWDSRDGKVEFCKQDVEKSGLGDNLFVQCHYRPFDDRWTYYTGNSRGLIGWPVWTVMRHFIAGENIALTLSKKAAQDYRHVFITDKITESGNLSGKPSENAYIFPLYLYGATAEQLGAPAAERAPNLNMAIVQNIAQGINLRFSPQPAPRAFTPQQLFDYIYAVLHSPAYRAKYAQFLKSDFPRIPRPSSAKQFRRLAKIGEQLRQTHLLQHPALRQAAAAIAFPVPNGNIVQAGYPKFVPDANGQTGSVCINKTQRFTGVPAAVWQHKIGGYHPARQFLKDRQNRPLAYNDTERYKTIIAALAQTIALINTLDD